MKILIVHASAGAGHTKAAEAVYNGLKSQIDHTVDIVDILRYTPAFYKNIYRKSYSFLVSKMPWLWGIFFSIVDVPGLRRAVRLLRRFLNRFNARRFERLVKTEQFDYIFSTHFFPNEVLAALKRAGKISATIVSIITDYDVHSIWIADGIDYYAVACSYTKQKAESLGVASEKVVVTGIPTDEKFSQEADPVSLKSKIGIRQGVFTVLIATGSFGIGPIEDVIRSLKDYQIVVVCGHNKGLYNRLVKECRDMVRVLGLVDNMHELMAASDCMVTKPGGLSISEALVRHLPLIFFNAIPGQETHNVEVLQRYGIGFVPASIHQISSMVKHLRGSSENYKAEQAKMEALAKPDAVQSILSLIR